ncbi:MAG: PP2C family protein-serine/threonine phosphatase [Candidatus Gracilibacteria bacterium]|nr:PP2C family protein-serine/threonine phosphatase [Candidatus Gracilibacteria bacterium]
MRKNLNNTLLGKLLLTAIIFSCSLLIMSGVADYWQVKSGKLEVVRRVLAYTETNSSRLKTAYLKSESELDKLILQDFMTYPDIASFAIFSDQGYELYSKTRNKQVNNLEYAELNSHSDTNPARCLPAAEIDTAEGFYAKSAALFGKKISSLFSQELNCAWGEVAGIEVIRPLNNEKGDLLRYRFSYQGLYEGLMPLCFLSLVSFVMLLVAALLFYIFIVLPLSEVKKSAYAMASGNLDRRINVKSRTEIGVISNFINEVSRNLAKVIHDLDEKERLSSELEIATKIQQNLLPEQIPELPGLEIYAKTRSTTEVGGDTFDYIQQDADNTLIYIGDVTGHGVPACLVMIMVDVLLHTFSKVYKNIKDVFVQVNKNLTPRIDATMFITMLLLKWNVPNQKLSYIGAGHEYIIHYHARSKKSTTTPSGGIALGMVPEVENLVEEKTLNLEVGDVIVIYSDGITEALNERGEMFGLDKLASVIERFGYQDAKGIFNNTTKILSEFMGKKAQRDDMTLIVLKYKGASLEEIENMSRRAKLSIKDKMLERDKAKWDWKKR